MFDGIRDWFDGLGARAPEEKPSLQKFSEKYPDGGEMRLHLIFHGRVQGVGFRYSSMMSAEGLGLTGWVQNLADGTVEMQVQGRTAVIDRMIDELASNQFILIRRIDDERIPLENGEEKFIMAN